MSIFQERLYEARKLRKLTQHELAFKAGMTGSALCHYEAGRRDPSLDNLKMIADALNVSADYLMGIKPEPGCGGPLTDQLLADFNRMSDADRGMLADFAALVASK